MGGGGGRSSPSGAGHTHQRINAFVAKSAPVAGHAQIVGQALVAARSGGALLAMALPALHVTHRPQTQVRLAVALLAALRPVVPIAMGAMVAELASGAGHARALAALQVALAVRRCQLTTAQLAASARIKAP